MFAPSSIALPAILDRLCRAWNARDVHGLVSCFHPNYKSTYPHHPDGDTRGLDNVRRSWAHLFEAVPDFCAHLCRFAVMIFGLAGDRIGWARIYTETDPMAGPDIDAVLEDILSRAVWP